MTVRMSRTDADERMRLVQAAHAARRGQTDGVAALRNRAIGNQSAVGNISDYEWTLCDLLAERGVSFTQQVACGPYNVDITVGNVAASMIGVKSLKTS